MAGLIVKPADDVEARASKRPGSSRDPLTPSCRTVLGVDNGPAALLNHHHQRGDGLLVEFSLFLQEAGITHPAWGNDPRIDHWLRELPPTEAVSLSVVAAEQVATTDTGFGAAACCVVSMIGSPPPFGIPDIRLMLSFDGLANDGFYARQRLIGLVLVAVQRLLLLKADGARALADEVAGHLAAWNPDPLIAPVCREPPEVWRLLEAALALAQRPPPDPNLTVGPIARLDGFGVAAIERLGADMQRWPSGALPLLVHCANAKSARPSTAWTTKCRALLQSVPEGAKIVESLLTLIPAAPPAAFMTDHERQHRLLSSWNDDLARGLVWSAGLAGGDWVVPALEAVANRCIRDSRGRVIRQTPVAGEKVQYACFHTLAATGTLDAAAALGRLVGRTSNRNSLKRLRVELEAMAERLGLDATDLLEVSLPEWGLDAGGSAAIDFDSAEAVLRLDNAGGVSVHWVVNGRETDQPPAVLPPADAAFVKERQAELSVAAAAERRRLEDLFVAAREWPLHEFHRRMVTHHLTGWYARRLFWEIDGGLGRVIGLPTDDPRMFATATGPTTVDDGATVKIWHPARSAPEDVRKLRDLAGSLGVVQPIRQAWRQDYRPDDVELAVGLYSTRYAGHILRFRQFYTLARERGWSGAFLSGVWDGGQSALAYRDYEAAGVRAQWHVASLETEKLYDDVELAVTDRVTFWSLDRTPAPVAIGEVPAEIFSEAYRDLDLFTSVCTVANDPFWIEKFTPESRQLHEYWEAMAEGGFANAAIHRRDALEATIPTIAGSDRFVLEDRYLSVRGNLWTYRIDLATANVRVEPSGRLLYFDGRTASFPAAPHAPALGPLPPVDDDVILGRIILRAGLLASDDQIHNPSLRKQLRARR